MCGIVGYIGNNSAFEVILKGLKRLEYRGYDSSGIALLKDKELKIFKKQGKVSILKELTKGVDTSAKLGIGHTRWATHGEPSDVNSHPHVSKNGKYVLVHNGIIENYDTIKQGLIELGYTFKSDTDTEVLVNLIQEVASKGKATFKEIVKLSLTQIEGAYAILVFNVDNPNEIICARKSSPMVIGVGEGEYFIASDTTPIVEYTKNVIYLKDHEIASVNIDGVNISSIHDDRELEPYIQELHLKLEAIEKGGFEHFMLKEIFEQPQSIQDCMRGRVSNHRNEVKLGGIKDYIHRLCNVDRIIIVGCGTSWHAALVGEYLIEEFARINVEVEYASEFRYRNPILSEKDMVIAISQSGETADTLAALELAKEKGATILGICNVVGSSIPRITDAGIYTHAGPEIGVASTKAFTTQVTTLSLLAFYLGKERYKITPSRLSLLLNELENIPKLINQVLDKAEDIKRISKKITTANNCLFLGRGINFPVALEGALKLKEISYIHAEGYPAAEMKHGPIALIDENMPIVIIALQNNSYDKIVSNIQEIKARKGQVFAIVNKGDKTIAQIADYVIEIPLVDVALSPLITVIPLQLLSYYIALDRGCNVDQPRNLAKSVTVE